MAILTFNPTDRLARRTERVLADTQKITTTANRKCCQHCGCFMKNDATFCASKTHRILAQRQAAAELETSLTTKLSRLFGSPRQTVRGAFAAGVMAVGTTVALAQNLPPVLSSLGIR